MTIAQVEVDQVNIKGDVNEPEEDIIEDNSCHCPHIVRRIKLASNPKSSL